MYKHVATIPCHNDAAYLENAVNALKKELSINTSDYVILIAEDGSTDGSDQIASKLASQNPSIIHVHADRKLGRGLALMNVWGMYKAEIYSYIDCDLATDMMYFPKLIQYIEDFIAIGI